MKRKPDSTISIRTKGADLFVTIRQRLTDCTIIGEHYHPGRGKFVYRDNSSCPTYMAATGKLILPIKNISALPYYRYQLVLRLLAPTTTEELAYMGRLATAIEHKISTY